MVFSDNGGGDCGFGGEKDVNRRQGKDVIREGDLRRNVVDSRKGRI